MSPGKHEPSQIEGQKSKESVLYSKYWEYNLPDPMTMHASSRYARGRNISRQIHAKDEGLPKDASWDDIRKVRAVKFGLPETASWDEVNARVREVKKRDFSDMPSVDKKKSSLDLAEEILKENGIVGRGMTNLMLSLAAHVRGSSAEMIKSGQPIYFRLDRKRELLIEEIKKDANIEHTDPLEANKRLWESNFLHFDYLNNTFTGKKDEMIDDAKIINLMAALVLASWGKTKKKEYGETIAEVEPQLQEYALKTAKVSNWDELVKIAREFTADNLRKKMNEIASIWHEKYSIFGPDSKTGRAVDDILETDIVIEKPDEIMNSAKQVYKKIFGLDLDKIKPVVRSG